MSTEASVGQCLLSIMSSVSFISCTVLTYTVITSTKAHFSSALLLVSNSIIAVSIFAILEGVVGPGTYIKNKHDILVYSSLTHALVFSPLLVYYVNFYICEYLDAIGLSSKKSEGIGYI